jgi:hypothetical protein
VSDDDDDDEEIGVTDAMGRGCLLASEKLHLFTSSRDVCAGSENENYDDIAVRAVLVIQDREPK